MPVGRLDFMTEGLLLLTNDGEFKRQLELPSTAVVRQYRARAFGHVTQDQLERLAEGVTIDGMRYGPIIANLERRTGRNCWIEMSLTEGKNREVRNVLGFLGLQVSRLIRTAYGPLDVAGHGAWRRRRGRARRSWTRFRAIAEVRIIAGAVARPPAAGAAGLGHAPDRRPGARSPVLDARQPARARSRTCASPTFLRAAVRWASRPCRAARRKPSSSKRTRRRRPRSRRTRRSWASRDKIRVLGGSALALPRSEPFDLILADPPYANGSGTRAGQGRQPKRAGSRPAAGSRVETERRDAVDPGDLSTEADRQIGKARITLLRRP